MLLLAALTGSRRLRCWRPALCLLGAALLMAPSAHAAQLFHSPGDDGVPAIGPPTIAEGGVQSVFLYIDGGAAASAAGSACNGGVGDEVCGFSVTLTGLGGLTVSSFNADAGADLLVNQSAGAIVIHGLDPVSPLPGPQRIGELLVNAVTGGSVELSSGEVVGADLASEVLSADTLVAVPEPAQLALLASGLLLLPLLQRLAERRARRC